MAGVEVSVRAAWHDMRMGRQAAGAGKGERGAGAALGKTSDKLFG